MIDKILIEKYRPDKLDEIIGQDLITQKLKLYVLVKNMPHLMFAGFHGTGKTSSALCLAKEMYGVEWRANFLELNSSDERGIDVVREKIKDYAGSTGIGERGHFKILLLDEVDNMTRDAQNALRRIMEVYTSSCRFILSCNYISKIIEPLISRCQLYRFRRIQNSDIILRLKYICSVEQIKYEDTGLEAIAYVADGDLRKAIGLLDSSRQAVTVETVYDISLMVDPIVLRDAIKKALSREFFLSLQIIDNLVNDGIDTRNILRQMSLEVMNINIDDKMKSNIIREIAETDFQIAEGADERIQLKGLIASIVGIGYR
jgi:replication factor C small subunit